MSRTSLVRAVALAAGFGLLGAASAVPASAQITFTPFVGSFYGLSKYFDDDIDLSVFGGSGTARFTSEQTNTAMFGARVSVPIGATLSVEGEFGYSSSDVRLTGQDAAGQGLDLSTNLKGNVIVGSLRGLIRPRRSNLHLIVGAAVVNHGGDAWDFSTNEKLTNVGGVLGFGLRAAVTPRFAINITAESYIYSFNPDTSDDTSLGFYKKTTQADVIVSIGVPLSLSK